MERAGPWFLTDKEGVVMKRSVHQRPIDPIAPMAMDDPVPAGSSTSIERPDCVQPDPHAIEREVRKRLASAEGIRFMELVVRRLPNGVCLEGVVHTDGECPDVAKVVREIAKVDQVINRLLVLPAADKAAVAAEELLDSFEMPWSTLNRCEWY